MDSPDGVEQIAKAEPIVHPHDDENKRFFEYRLDRPISLAARTGQDKLPWTVVHANPHNGNRFFHAIQYRESLDGKNSAIFNRRYGKCLQASASRSSTSFSYIEQETNGTTYCHHFNPRLRLNPTHLDWRTYQVTPSQSISSLPTPPLFVHAHSAIQRLQINYPKQFMTSPPSDLTLKMPPPS